ncbi:hypothetical protein E6H34_02620 [Candidatus Bathyarchaeota archaeon]|nr:MAG: hypothetical protein E6H34_02620 [Candidatus Bathyarchaeota archaeon]
MAADTGQKDMPERKRLLLVVPGWASLVSSIALARLFTAPTLRIEDFALIFASSILAGSLAGDLENAMIGFISTLILSTIIIGLVLVSPAILGLTGPLYEQVAEREAAIGAFQAIFPFTLVLVLAGGIVGSGLAERFAFD